MLKSNVIVEDREKKHNASRSFVTYARDPALNHRLHERPTVRPPAARGNRRRSWTAPPHGRLRFPRRGRRADPAKGRWPRRPRRPTVRTDRDSSGGGLLPALLPRGPAPLEGRHGDGGSRRPRGLGRIGRTARGFDRTGWGPASVGLPRSRASRDRPKRVRATPRSRILVGIRRTEWAGRKAPLFGDPQGYASSASEALRTGSFRK
jgi:hypothetical protein